MILYHGSPAGGLTELQPFVSEHKEPYVYLASNPVVALLYAVRPVPKPFSWYTYGFDGEVVVYSEYWQDAFKELYKGKTGFLYECEAVDGTENPTAINCAYTCRKPIPVSRVTEIPDLYEQFMKYSEAGLFRIKPLESVPPKKLQIAHDDLAETIEKHNLYSIPDSEMSTFIKSILLIYGIVQICYNYRIIETFM